MSLSANDCPVNDSTFNNSPNGAQMLEIGAQVVQNTPANPAENPICAPIVGPQGAITGAKIDLVDRPATPRERLATTLARLSSQGIQEVLALAVDDTQIVVFRGRGRPEALDVPGRKKVLLLLTLGYTRALAAAELGIARSTITRTMRRDADFRQQVLDAEELFERTPLLTIIEASQRSWRAAAWLVKNYQPHLSVTRRKRDQQLRENARHNKQYFKSAFEAMDAGRPQPKVSSDADRSTTRPGKRSKKGA